MLEVVVVLVVLAVWVSFLYALSWRARLGNSDNANAVLAGHEMIRGNVLLRGWTLPADTYWTIDLPVFGLFTAVAGIGPAVMHAVPVLFGTAVILVGALLAGHGRPLRHSWIGWGAVFLLLGLPHPFLTAFFLQAPHHVGTTLFCLLAFWLLGSPPGNRRWWAGVTLLMVAVLGDPFALAIGVAPVVAAGLVAALRRRRWEPALASGAVAVMAVAGATLVSLALDHAGAHRLAPPLPLSPASNWGSNLRQLPSLLSSLLGAGRDGGLTGLFRTGHLLGVAAVVTAVTATAALVLVGFLRRPYADRTLVSRWDPGRSWLDDVLLMALGGSLAACVLIFRDLASARYLLPSLAYGAVLTGRRLGEAAERLPRRALPVVTTALLAVASLYLAASISALRRPPPADPAHDLVSWLAANDLAAGFGQYWSASVMTVESRGAVTVRPVAAADGRLHANLYYASVDWFRTDSQTPRRFVVYQASDQPLDGIDDRSAEATFGPPARAAQIGPYRVLIWDKDLTGELGPPS